MKRLGLPLIAVLLVAAVLGIQVAADGGHYVPLAQPIHVSSGPFPPIPTQLEPLAEQIVLVGVNSAACRLGISRERLVLAIAETRSLDPRAAAALKAGLLDAVDRLDREGRLPKVSQLLPQALDQPISPESSRRSSAAFRPAWSTARSPPGRCCAVPLTSSTSTGCSATQRPSQLQSTVQSAVLQAALGEILDRLRP